MLVDVHEVIWGIWAINTICFLNAGGIYLNCCALHSFSPRGLDIAVCSRNVCYGVQTWFVVSYLLTELIRFSHRTWFCSGNSIFWKPASYVGHRLDTLNTKNLFSINYMWINWFLLHYCVRYLLQMGEIEKHLETT